MRTILLFLLSLCVGAAYANSKKTNKNNTAVIVKSTADKPAANKTKKPTNTKMMRAQNIVGHPINSRDSYTINGNKTKSATVECIFINTANKPVNLHIWTNPTNQKPQETVRLGAGAAAKPVQVSLKLFFKLEKHWWCPVFNKKQPMDKWNNCAYLSIADAAVINHNPFSNMLANNTNKNVSYHCRFKSPNGMSFFYDKVENMASKS